jgi:hypothetical protein
MRAELRGQLLAPSTHLTGHVLLLAAICSRCAVQATCRSWRAAGAASATANAAVAAGRLPTEEKIDSLGLWLEPRAHLVRHLQYGAPQAVSPPPGAPLGAPTPPPLRLRLRLPPQSISTASATTTRRTPLCSP